MKCSQAICTEFIFITYSQKQAVEERGLQRKGCSTAEDQTGVLGETGMKVRLCSQQLKFV